MGIKPGELVIDDGNWQQHADEVPEGQGRGRIPRDFAKVPYGSMPYAAAFPQSLLIPRSDWSARIKEMEETKTRLSDVMIAAGIKSLDQNGTNFCWTNGVVTAVEAVMVVQHGAGAYVPLSSASVAAPIKGYRNEGGWGAEALEYIVKYGIVPVSMWPANAIDRRYDTAESRAERAKYKVTEWFDLRSRSFDEKMSMLLRRIPVPSGYNWWRHETCGIDPVEIEPGHFGSRERNSWGASYGQDGYFILAESKSNPDDAVAPRTFLPS